MSEFFKSEIVQEELNEINELQKNIYGSLFSFHTLNREDQLEKVDLLIELLQKQRIMYTRLSLSDDPHAKMMKENIIKSAKEMGFPPTVDLNYMFTNITNVVANMRKSIDES